MSVKLVTFKTNHTIIAVVDCNDKNEVVLKQPVQVVMQPSKDGPMMAFAPFLDFSQEFNSGIKISMDNVLCITSPVVELENQYNQVFGSGIQIASAIPKV
jgi:hypothetical protein